MNQKDLRPLRKQLLESAVQFQEQFVSKRNDDPTLQIELARAYARLGRITGEIDAKRQSADYLQQALTRFRQLEQAGQFNTATKVEFGRCQCDLADIRASLGEVEQAFALFESACAFAANLMAEAPDELRYPKLLAEACRRQGTLLRHHRKINESEAPLLQAVRVGDELLRRQPESNDFRVESARNHTVLGNLYTFQIMKRRNEAEAHFQKAIELLQPIVEVASAQAEHRALYSLLHRNLAALYRRNGREADSEKWYVRSIELYEALANDHPHVTSYWASLAGSIRDLGTALTAAQRLGEAGPKWQAALRIQERLVARDADDIFLATGLAEVQCKLGIWESKHRQDYAAALDWFGRAIGTVEEVCKRAPNYDLSKQILWEGLQGRAAAHTALGQYAAAIADWDRTLEIADPAMHTWTQAQRALTIARSSDHVRAANDTQQLIAGLSTKSSGVFHTYHTAAIAYSVSAGLVHNDPALTQKRRGELAEHYSDTAVDLLNKAQQAGFPATDKTWENRDFDSIRSRADFQTLRQRTATKPKSGDK